jgi:hypothetical protein
LKASLNPFKGNQNLRDKIWWVIEQWIVKKQHQITYTYRPPDEILLIKQAINRIRAFQMVEGGVSTYQQLGYPSSNGVLAWFVLQEHFEIKQFFLDAKEMAKK